MPQNERYPISLSLKPAECEGTLPPELRESDEGYSPQPGDIEGIQEALLRAISQNGGLPIRRLLALVPNEPEPDVRQ